MGNPYGKLTLVSNTCGDSAGAQAAFAEVWGTANFASDPNGYFFMAPAGVGAGQKPPRFLAPGDVVRVELPDLGCYLENQVQAAAPMRRRDDTGADDAP